MEQATVVPLALGRFNRRNGSVSCDRREQAAVPLRYDRTGRPASRMSVGEASGSEWGVDAVSDRAAVGCYRTWRGWLVGR